MKISYMGTGYVGQVSGTVSAHYGHDVWLVDIDENKVNSINQGKPTIFEKDLDEMLYDLAINKKKLCATLDIHQAVLDTDASFICVGTPDRGGMIDLSYIQNVSKSIGIALKEKSQFHLVIVKSTVVPGTTLKTVKPILEEFSGKKAGKDFGIAMNPEFLREGLAVSDNIDPDSI
ncbi:MAG: UDP-glucose 6-dehydrogenase, partial [Promethearchaeota archaeon]